LRIPFLIFQQHISKTLISLENLDDRTYVTYQSTDFDFWRHGRKLHDELERVKGLQTIGVPVSEATQQNLDDECVGVRAALS
jgi:hypothetical protein